LIYGGAQERGTRGGTENVAGIVGLAKALEISYRDLEKNHNHISYLKSFFIELLTNGLSKIFVLMAKASRKTKVATRL
jgi:cysteine desulfurase